MNGGHLLGLSFFEKIGTFFDIIPKIIYFLSAVFLSAIDALQCLVRKLAGLDVYYVKQAGTGQLQASVRTDPLSEFIYGILGISTEKTANTVALYKGLNTVFWSLAIFAVICLAVTTMIAIIKSHYNEDVGATNPWKYVYTACKAVLTFAIVPFTVIIGMQLATWTLQTLDGITAGSATEESLRGIYGSAYNVFEGGTLPGDDTEDPTKYYSHYDFFGAGTPTSSTPFSGMLFKACSYDANRARTNSEISNAICTIASNNGQKIFGQADNSSSAVADQVDYAFMNNLYVSGGMSGNHIEDALVDAGVMYWDATDMINPLMHVVPGFSKWNVGTVWFFYNLWSYNFIVAFGGGITIMGIMLSVIIGLMSRLMKGAVLFLIYPALLGIAPMDNFKAFKSCISQFIQQVMMAFGAIIGMNLTLLVLPYVQNIKFFNIGVVDNIVNIVLVMTALMLMKDIIAMISAFAGGADANNVGSGLKGEVGKAIGSGAKLAGVAGVAAGAGVVGVGVATGKAIGRRVSKSVNSGRKKKLARHDELAGQIAERQNKINALENADNTKEMDLLNMAKSGKMSRKEFAENYKTSFGGGKKGRGAADDFFMLATGKKTADDVSSAVAKGAFEKTKLGTVEDRKDQIAKLKKLQERDKEKYDDFERKGKKGGDSKQVKLTNAVKRYEDSVAARVKGKEDKKIKGAGFELQEDGSYKNASGEVFTRDEALKASSFKGRVANVYNGAKGKVSDWLDEQSLLNAGKHMADGFLKGMTSLSSSAGLDKLLGGLGGIFKDGANLKGGVFKPKEDKYEGDKLAEHNHAEALALQKKHHEEMMNALKEKGGSAKGSAGGLGDPSAFARAMANVLTPAIEKSIKDGFASHNKE